MPKVVGTIKMVNGSTIHIMEYNHDTKPSPFTGTTSGFLYNVRPDPLLLEGEVGSNLWLRCRPETFLETEEA